MKKKDTNYSSSLNFLNSVLAKSTIFFILKIFMSPLEKEGGLCHVERPEGISCQAVGW